MIPTQEEDVQTLSLHPEWKEVEKTSMLGMVIFLGSWTMLFAGLFYVFGSYRLSLSAWPPAGAEPLPPYNATEFCDRNHDPSTPRKTTPPRHRAHDFPKGI